jgi:hypothetical protein
MLRNIHNIKIFNLSYCLFIRYLLTNIFLTVISILELYNCQWIFCSLNISICNTNLTSHFYVIFCCGVFCDLLVCFFIRELLICVRCMVCKCLDCSTNVKISYRRSMLIMWYILVGMCVCCTTA